MEERRFNILMAHVASGYLSKEEDIKQLVEYEDSEQLEERTLSEEQVLRLVEGLLNDVEVNGYNSILVKQGLELNIKGVLEIIKEGWASYSENTKKLLQTLIDAGFPNRSYLTGLGQSLFSTLNAILLNIPFRIILWLEGLFGKKITEPLVNSLSTALENVTQQFNETVKDSAAEAYLMGCSMREELQATIGKYTLSSLSEVIEIINNLEEKLEKPGIIDRFSSFGSGKKDDLTLKRIHFLQQTNCQLNACIPSPSVSEIILLKSQVEEHIKSLPNDGLADYKEELERVLNYMKGLEAKALFQKNAILFTYSGIQQKHQRLLESDSLSSEEKEFIKELKAALVRYVTYPVDDQLELIEGKINAKLNKGNLNNKTYKNNLKGVLSWITSQKSYFSERKEFFKEQAAIYEKLQQGADLMLPLDQGFDLYAGKGMCAGYQAAWGIGALNGNGEKPIFGVKPDDEKPPFKLAPYSKLKSVGSALNHLFPVTPNITELQNVHGKNVHGEVVSWLSGKINKNNFGDLLVKTVKSDSDSQQVFNIVVSIIDKNRATLGYHTLGLWRTDKGVYHFFDANYGWFRCKDEKAFTTWIKSYLSSIDATYGEVVRFDQLSEPWWNSWVKPPASENIKEIHRMEALALETPNVKPQTRSPSESPNRREARSQLVKGLTLEAPQPSKEDAYLKENFKPVFHQSEHQTEKSVQPTAMPAQNTPESGKNK